MSFKRRATIVAAAILTGVAYTFPARAGGALTAAPVPPVPSPDQVEQNVPALANLLNKPITGGSEDPLVVGTLPPPSLEVLQAGHPGDQKGDGMEPGWADMVRTAALTYGAQGGLAARSFAINQMLRRYQAQRDGAFDFGTLVLAVGSGQTLMRPPIVTAAQMAFALGDNGQVARETSCIYQITREAQLASTPPNWRSYLVRTWSNPHRPIDTVLPRTKQEAAYWNKWVAEGWAQGKKQAVEIFLSDLGRLERDIIGMARYRVLLRANLVELPKLAFQTQRVDGGRDSLHVGDKTIRITDQPGLQRNPPALGTRRGVSAMTTFHQKHGSEVVQHRREIARLMHETCDDRRVVLGVDHEQVGVSSQGPEPISGGRETELHASEQWLLGRQPGSGERCRKQVFSGYRIVRGNPFRGLAQFPPRARGKQPRRHPRRARTASMAARTSPSTSSVVENPSRRPSSTAASSDVTKAARRSSASWSRRSPDRTTSLTLLKRPLVTQPWANRSSSGVRWTFVPISPPVSKIDIGAHSPAQAVDLQRCGTAGANHAG
jgi:defect-in-organelle-trafficking protein DotC